MYSLRSFRVAPPALVSLNFLRPLTELRHGRGCVIVRAYCRLVLFVSRSGMTRSGLTQFARETGRVVLVIPHRAQGLVTSGSSLYIIHHPYVSNMPQAIIDNARDLSSVANQPS